MACEYAVEVPAGTRSLTGSVLERAFTWRFATAPAEPCCFRDEGRKHDRKLAFSFDFGQRIDPAAVLPTVRVAAAGADVPVALDDANPQPRGASSAAFTIVDRFPQSALVTVTIGPGTPSAEGPRLTTRPSVFSFKTPGPFVLARSWSEPAYGRDGRVREWTLEFSAALDGEAFAASTVRIEPAIPGWSAAVRDQRIVIEATPCPRTTYRVTVAADLRDRFGRTLGEETSCVFEVGPEEKALWLPREGLVVLDPAAPPRYPVFTVNHTKLAVLVYRVEPARWSSMYSANP